MDNSNRPSIRAYVGATGSGKGVSVREYLARQKPSRLFVWDPLDEYGYACDLVTADLGQAIEATRARTFRVAFFPGGNAKKYAPKFDLFCRAAWSAGNLECLVEELSDVTLATGGQPSWQRLVRAGRHRGVRLVGCTQRPARVDKDFLGNNTYVRVFQLDWPDDFAVMAKVLRVPVGDVEQLVTTQGQRETVIRYIERDKALGKTNKGELRLART